MDRIVVWIDQLEVILQHAMQNGVFLALCLGYIISIGLTQWVKMLPWTSSNKWVIRLTALPIGFITTFFLWPSDLPHMAVRIAMSLAVGVSSPWIYQIVTRVVFKFWPHIENKISANPGGKSDEDA